MILSSIFFFEQPQQKLQYMINGRKNQNKKINKIIYCYQNETKPGASKQNQCLIKIQQKKEDVSQEYLLDLFNSLPLIWGWECVQCNETR